MAVRAALFIPFVIACGGGTPAGDDAGNGDAATDAVVTPDVATPIDGGDAGGTYPAFTPDMPTIVDIGGAVLATPKIVTVTWSADPNAAALEAFDDAIGASAYFAATTSEYGIAAGASGGHASITTPPPATLSDTALDTLVAQQVGAAPGSGWPVNDPNTMYVVFIPEATELTSSGSDACSVEDGYHDETYTKTIAHIVYAVIDERCHDSKTGVIAFSTEVASHEVVEASTDPHTQTDFAWAGFDQNHWAWEVWNTRQDELADACEYFDEANYQSPASFDYWLQRSWSNASGAAGHDPCVPVPSGAYFNVAALAPETITVMTTKKSVTTHGYSILVGQKKTIQLGAYSDGPLAPWTLTVVEGDGFSTPNPARLTIAQSSTSAQNGDTIGVDVTTNTTKASGVLITAISQVGSGPAHYMPILIATE